jgi:hypothetical protein
MKKTGFAALFPAIRVASLRAKLVSRVLLVAALFSAFGLAASPGAAAETKKAAGASMLTLSDLPENWSGPTATKADSNKCSDLTGLLKSGSTSTSRVRFENGSDSLVHVVAQFTTTALADASFARISKWSKDCAKWSYKVDGRKIAVTMSAVNFTPTTPGLKFNAYREALDAGGFQIDVRLVFYRKGFATGILAFAGLSVDTELLKDTLQIATSRA